MFLCCCLFSSCDIADLVDADNILGDQDMAFMGQEERYEFVLKKEMLISRRIAELNLNQDDANLYESYVLKVFILFKILKFYFCFLLGYENDYAKPP